MIDERGLVALLYRADWQQLSLSGEVHGTDRSVELIFTQTWRPRPGEPFPPFSPPSPSDEITDVSLLLAPGKRYRAERPDGQRARGCDGERAWEWFRDLPAGMEVRFGGGPRAPFPVLLDPSWLLAGYDLSIEGEATACERPAIRVTATARRDARYKGVTGELRMSAFRWPPLPRADRVVADVDAELGILLRCEARHGEREPDVTEFRSLTVAAEADPARFTAPPGSVFADGSSPWSSGFPFGGAGREAAKTAAGLAAAGLGAVIRCSPSARTDPFTRATQEAEDPDAAMPEEDAPAPDDPPVSDEVLHLLYRSGMVAPRFTATLHQWFDAAGLFDAVPERARRAGFGGVGFLVDTVRDAALDSGTDHYASRLRIGGWDRYRIDLAYPVPPRDQQSRRDWRRRSLREPLTDACDGQRRWRVYTNRVLTGPAEPPPDEVTDLADASWLLACELSGGAEVTVGGRRAYRIVARGRYRLPPLLDVLSMAFFPAVAAVDAESGRLLRLTRYKGGKPVVCGELRDLAPDESEDFGFEPPAGLRVEEQPPEPEPGQEFNPAADAVKAVADAARGFLGSLRDRRR